LNKETPDKKAALLLRFMEQRELLGFEKSFKMSEKTLLANRFLLGVSRQEVPQNSLFVICERLGMQDDHLSALMDNLPGADIVHFGFEENEGGCVYKVYLEYCAKYRREQNAGEPILLHLAFKWNPLTASAGSIASYIYHPGLSIAKISERVTAIYSGAGNRISLAIAQDIIHAASARVSANNLMYIEVSEQGNPRRSFDINLYEANLQLAKVEDSLFSMSRHYAIPDGQFEPLYDTIKSNRLGHLSGGIDREGRDFFTVYYEPDVTL
jgi:hypothetical protein